MLASFPSPSFNELQIGPLELHIYGVLIALGVAAAITVLRRRYVAFGGDEALADRVALWTVIGGFTGARIAYVLPRLDRFIDDPLEVFAIWNGGLAFFGGLTVGSLTALFLLRRWGADIPRFADAMAIALPLAQAIGRWGNYFNQELFGTPTDLPWAVEIDPGPAAAAGYPDERTFHPTFLYESLWNFGVVGVLLLIERRMRIRRGNLFVLYLLFYGVGRFLLELIRTDTVWRFAGLSRNAWVALLVATIGASLFLWRQRGRGTEDTDADTQEGVVDAAEDDAPLGTFGADPATGEDEESPVTPP